MTRPSSAVVGADISLSHWLGDAMKRYREQAIFALNVMFALVSLALLALDLVQAEVALTRHQLPPLNHAAATTAEP